LGRLLKSKYKIISQKAVGSDKYFWYTIAFINIDFQLAKYLQSQTFMLNFVPIEIIKSSICVDPESLKELL
jgi:hypothetical protein